MNDNYEYLAVSIFVRNNSALLGLNENMSIGHQQSGESDSTRLTQWR